MRNKNKRSFFVEENPQLSGCSFPFSITLTVSLISCYVVLASSIHKDVRFVDALTNPSPAAASVFSNHLAADYLHELGPPAQPSLSSTWHWYTPLAWMYYVSLYSASLIIARQGASLPTARKGNHSL